MAEVEFKIPAAPSAVQKDEYDLVIPVEGREGEGLRFYKPTPEQSLILTQANSRLSSEYDKVVLIFRFLEKIMHQADYEYLYERFTERNATFRVDDLAQMLDSLVKHFAKEEASNRAEKRAVDKA